MKNSQPSGKVEAARKLTESLQNDFDIDAWLLGHPNESNALESILDDLDKLPDSSRWCD